MRKVERSTECLRNPRNLPKNRARACQVSARRTGEKKQLRAYSSQTELSPAATVHQLRRNPLEIDFRPLRAATNRLPCRSNVTPEVYALTIQHYPPLERSSLGDSFVAHRSPCKLLGREMERCSTAPGPFINAGSADVYRALRCPAEK